MATAEQLHPTLDRPRRRRPSPLETLIAGAGEAISQGTTAPPGASAPSASSVMAAAPPASTSQPRPRPEPVLDIPSIISGITDTAFSYMSDPREFDSPERVAASNSTERMRQDRSMFAMNDNAKPKQRRSTVQVPEIVPPRFREAVAKHGQRLNDVLQDAGSNLSGPEYLAKLIQFESGWNKRAYNPSSAFGFGQFIDSTAEDFRERLGVETQDPSRPNQMIKGASMHASGDYGYNPLYAGYNPGYSSTDPIPGVASGENVPVKVNRKALKRAAGGGPVSTGGGGTEVPSLIQIGKRAERKFDVEAREQPHFDPVDPVHTEGSMHYSGDAIDFQGTPEQLSRLNRWLARRYGSETDEMFYDPGINIADGQRTSAIGGHPTHVHFGLDDGSEGATAFGVTGGVSGATAAGVGAATGGSIDQMLSGGMQAAPQQRRPRPTIGTTPIQNPLSAQAALPQGLSTAAGEDEGPLARLLAEEEAAAEEAILEAFRPRRRR